MKGKLKLLYTAIAVMFLCLPAYAQGTSENVISSITVDVSKNDYDFNESNIDATAVLVNSEANPRVFTGTLVEPGTTGEVPVNPWRGFRFKTNTGIEYGYDGQNSQADFSGSFTLTKQKSGHLYYSGSSEIAAPVKIEATLSGDESTLTVRFIQATPVYVVINSADIKVCDDINQIGAGSEIPCDTPVTVSAESPATVAVKIGNKSYGVTGGLSFEDSRLEQVVSGKLTESTDAVNLDKIGVYTVKIRLDEVGGYTLYVTKAASGNEMTFGEGNSLVYDKESGVWSGAFKMTAGQVLPAFTLTDYSETPAKDKSWHIQSDIDDPEGAETPLEAVLGSDSTGAKCITAGQYVFKVTVGADGSATATYRNTTPPVKIKDLYVCVYDKHHYGDTFGYDQGDSFSFDYKVTYQLKDGSYAVALCLNNSQSFYIRNNGIDYRPSKDDVWTTFGNGVDNAVEFTFTPSEDNSLRKHVSTSVGYRMIMIRPDDAGLKVSGYVIKLDDAKGEKKMNVIKSLAAPTEELGHMADVIIKFTNPENKEGYRDDYVKVGLNPSGTHGLYDVKLKAGQTFEIYRGRAIFADDGKTVIGIKDKDKVQYGCKNLPADGKASVTMTDGDTSTLYDQYAKDCKTKTYSVVRDGEFSFVFFYTTLEKFFSVSRKVPKDRGIVIQVYDSDGIESGGMVDMKYKNVNRRNLMTVQMPAGGYVKFGFPAKDENGNFTRFEPIDFYNLGLSNEVGYDTKPTGNKQQKFDVTDKGWYRFRMRLREDGNYYMSYQKIAMPDHVWLYVSNGTDKRTYEADQSTETPGHFIFRDVILNEGDEYYFVNRENGEIDPDWTINDGDPANGLIWYAAHDATNDGTADVNPVSPGRYINMFSHLNAGTDYQNKGHFKKFNVTGLKQNLGKVDIDMNITDMTHHFSYDFTGLHYNFEGSCAGIQFDDGDRASWAKKNDDCKFEYHPTTGYYTFYLPYLWGDWFIYNWKDNGSAQGSAYFPYNLNNMIHELNRPYYLSNGTEHFISDMKLEIPSGTAADESIEVGVDSDGKKTIADGVYKNRFIGCLAPGAVGLIQTGTFLAEWSASPVYKDVTVVFDPENNVLWLESGRVNGAPDIEDPYGELYIVFTDVTPAEWDKARAGELAAEAKGDMVKPKHWVKLNRDPNKFGHYTAEGVEFPARKVDDGLTTHSSYFFTNRLGETLTETIRYSNSYEAGAVTPDFADAADYDSMYGSIFTKLDYSSDGNFKTEEKPISLVKAANTVSAEKIYLRRWDNVEGAPFNKCIIPGTGDGDAAAAPRRAEGAESGNTGAADGGATETSSDIRMADSDPGAAAGDYVMRTFSSEPYTYNVDVHLGRKEFTLVTPGRGDIMTSVEELPAAGGEDTGGRAVIRTAAGHISVTGAASVSIYTLTGQCLISNAPGAELDVTPGIYIVVADGRASKHIL